MKYLLTIYSSPANVEVLPRAELEGMTDEYAALNKELIESGERLGGARLGDVSNARTVRVRDGRAEVTDGPYIEYKEHLAGYYIVECESADRAQELAAKIPNARYNAVEVWPLMATGGPDV
jgi:hypothetical protein